MKIYGGKAGFNSVSFTGERYRSVARLKGGKIITVTERKKEDLKIIKVLSKVPFVRSFNLIVETVIESWKLFLFVTIVLLLMRVFFNEKTSVGLLYLIPSNRLVLLCSVLIIAGLIIKLSSVSKYHAAEHMCANTYDKSLNLTLDYIKNQSRVHKDCGTNLIISFFICFVILFLVFGDTPWLILVAWSIGYELWRSEPKVIWSLILIIGKITQYVLYTSKPNEKHLLVAIAALRELEKEEIRGNIET
ncbi:DUF1385 domain-containing protein [Virgibacillus proomii]|uniref:DUF1385 domain-containing protein n=1 Tax=Virgibacillus proomii TaxID=84407 RepID=UPI0009872EEC|nr:DUF1385 domain-containing protein [Virgibacillus proomii]